MQGMDEFFLGLGEGHVPEGGGGGGRMPPAAETAGDDADIDLGDAAAGDQVDAIRHRDQGEEGVEVLHVHETAGDQGEIVDIGRQGKGDHDHRNPLNDILCRRLHQVVEEFDLQGRQVVGDELGDDVELGPFLKEPGGGDEVGRGGGQVGQGPRVLIDAETKDGRLLGGDGDLLPAQLFDEDGGRRADILDDLDLSLQVSGAGRMMIVEVQPDPGVGETDGERAEPLG